MKNKTALPARIQPATRCVSVNRMEGGGQNARKTIRTGLRQINFRVDKE